ncbi:MAG TPA: DUF4173 domain-containing protein [Tepidisphaeraceae bacterium]|nr:DUF4173 domain-containing protein [Tepidisphaeraceae bacterium]
MASGRSTISAGRGSTFVFAAALALVAAADFLFYRHAFGWTAGLFAAAVLLALLLRPIRRRSRRAAGWLALAVFGLALALAEEPTPLAISVASIAIVILAISRRDGWTGSSLAWLVRLGRFLLAGWMRIFSDAAVSLRWARRHPAAGMGGPAAVAWGIGKWVIPLLLGGVFVGLFALANPVVEDFVSRAFNWMWFKLGELPDLLDPARIALWAVIFVASWSLLRVRTRRLRRAPRPPYSRPGHLPPRLPGQLPPFDPASRTVIPVDHHALVERCLIVFNVIFAMESVLDVFYLYGGRHLPHGLTFKEYAHRGAYPLIATALLAAVFVLVAFRRECNSPSWRNARLLVYAWIAQNVLLAFSAGWRLMLLVNASNLTRLRLATAIWLVLVALGLLTIIWRIVTHRDNAALLRVNIAMTAAVLYACCFANLDGFIANYNADHCMEVARNGDVLGLTYLRDLGIESIPALDRLSHTLDTPQRRAMAAEFAAELRVQVADDLADWRGWTWRRWRLRPGPRVDRPRPGRPVLKSAASG